MAVIDFRANEIHIKIVYYGPGRGGKTTNLLTIHRFLKGHARGELLSVNTRGDRTLLFDFLPMDLETIWKYRIRISVYTVPGQVRYNDTRRFVLQGVDGIVFVADSLRIRRPHNVESLRNLDDNLRDQDRSIGALPLVMQYNKRDLATGAVEVLSIEELENDLNPEAQFEAFAASAVTGIGVKETFKRICVLTVMSVKEPFLREQRFGLSRG
jgi:signal recognition particle receptor subunit beta